MVPIAAGGRSQQTFVAVRTTRATSRDLWRYQPLERPDGIPTLERGNENTRINVKPRLLQPSSSLPGPIPSDHTALGAV